MITDAQAQQCFYGLTDKRHAIEIANRVCDVLGNGTYGVANLLILETACVETQLGGFLDPTPGYAGNGLCQHDKGPFYDVRTRTSERNRQKVLDAFGIDVRKVTWPSIQHSPLLAFIWCRLHYKLVPDEIPDIRSGRANYWKQFYNSNLGKGTPEKYLKQVNTCRLDDYLQTL